MRSKGWMRVVATCASEACSMERGIQRAASLVYVGLMMANSQRPFN
jgi:hypothetical protein